MKKIFLLLLSSAALAAEPIILDTRHTDAQGNTSSLYEHPELAPQAGGLEPHWHQEASITVHIKVSELLGAEQMEPGTRYRVDEISWVGHPQGWFVGGSRSVRLANGKEYADYPGLNRQKDGQTGVNRSEAAEGLSITRDDQLELILQWRNASAGGIYMRYFNAADGCSIGGTAMNLTPQGQLAGGTPGENFYNKEWRFNSPAIRLKATPIDSGNEKNLSSVYLALEVLAFVVLFILYLKARRRTS